MGFGGPWPLGRSGFGPYPVRVGSRSESAQGRRDAAGVLSGCRLAHWRSALVAASLCCPKQKNSACTKLQTVPISKEAALGGRQSCPKCTITSRTTCYSCVVSHESCGTFVVHESSQQVPGQLSFLWIGRLSWVAIVPIFCPLTSMPWP